MKEDELVYIRDKSGFCCSNIDDEKIYVKCFVLFKVIIDEFIGKRVDEIIKY